MHKTTRSIIMNTAIGASSVGLLFTVLSSSFTENDTPTSTSTHNETSRGVHRSHGLPHTTKATHTKPQRVNVPVKIKNRIPDKGRADNSGTFFDRENKTFATAMPIYKDTMIEMLQNESRDKTPGALTRDEIKELEKKGDLIW